MTPLDISMDTDPGILCFQHCGPKVFCFQLPVMCPACGGNLASEDFQLLPFRIPYPFVRASQHPCSIVIKPTAGDFLNDYLNSTDLHIGLTSSAGVVVEFDKGGLQQQRSNEWQQCLSVPGASGAWADHWDHKLHRIILQNCWAADKYDEHNFNCYSFVLMFLRSLQCGKLSEAAVSRTAFCESFIVPHTTAAGKYISLYRKLRRNGFYVHHSNDPSNLGLR